MFDWILGPVPILATVFSFVRLSQITRRKVGSSRSEGGKNLFAVHLGGSACVLAENIETIIKARTMVLARIFSL